MPLEIHLTYSGQQQYLLHIFNTSQFYLPLNSELIIIVSFFISRVLKIEIPAWLFKG